MSSERLFAIGGGVRLLPGMPVSINSLIVVLRLMTVIVSRSVIFLYMFRHYRVLTCIDVLVARRNTGSTGEAGSIPAHSRRRQP